MLLLGIVCLGAAAGAEAVYYAVASCPLVSILFAGRFGDSGGWAFFYNSWRRCQGWSRQAG